MTVEIRRQTLIGTRYIVHAIYVDGVELPGAQLSPFSEDEVEARVRAFLQAPPVLPDRTDAKRSELVAKGSIGGQMKRGGRPSKATVNERGFLWKEEAEE